MPGHYLHIDQGQGGIYTLPTITFDAQNEDWEVSTVGTSHCFTCVGVHIRLDDNGTKCFAAHISADLSDASVALTNRTGEWAKLYLDEAQAKSLYIEVRTKLHKISELREWVKQTDSATKAKNVFVVCPVSEDYQGKPLVGHHLVRAIRDFCELDDLMPDRAHGFCIGQHQAMVKANFSWLGQRDVTPSTAAYFVPDAEAPAAETLRSHGWERGNMEAPKVVTWEQAGPWSMTFHEGKWLAGPYRCPGHRRRLIEWGWQCSPSVFQ